MASLELAWTCVALFGLVWPCMAIYGRISSFLAVIDSNSFGLVNNILILYAKELYQFEKYFDLRTVKRSIDS